MQYFIKIFIYVSSLVLTLIPGKVFAWDPLDPINYYTQPYVGMDAQWRSTQLKAGYGNNLFKKNYAQGNLYLGCKITDYFGLELGYEITPIRSKTSELGSNDVALGVPVTAVPEVHISESRMRGWHAGVMGYYPVCNVLGNTLFRNPVELLGYVGLTRLNVYYQDVPVKAGGVPLDIDFRKRTFDETKSLLRVGLGMQYTYCTSGIRFMVGYESTRAFRNETPKEFPFRTSNRLRLQDSMFASIGAFVTIP